ncbi:MAG: hypothetical protein WDZ96_00750 [Acidimicrobiia bacterium]
MAFDVTALGEMQLVDPDGSEQRLGDRWQANPRVILFLRHFG